jgi:hypothetical protein
MVESYVVNLIVLFLVMTIILLCILKILSCPKYVLGPHLFYWTKTMWVSSFMTFMNIVLYQIFKNSLIIHEENTKKNHKRVVSLYVIKISLDLHKL